MRASLLVSAGAALLLVATLAHVVVAFEPEPPSADPVPRAAAPPPRSKPALLSDGAVLERLASLSGLDEGYVTRATFEFERLRRVSWTLEGVALDNGRLVETVAVATFDEEGRARFHASKSASNALPRHAPNGVSFIEILSAAAAPPSLVDAAGPGDRVLMIYDHARGPPYTSIEVPAFSLASGRLASIATEDARAPILRLVALQNRGLHGFHGEERAIVSLGSG